MLTEQQDRGAETHKSDNSLLNNFAHKVITSIYTQEEAGFNDVNSEEIHPESKVFFGGKGLLHKESRQDTSHRASDNSL